MWNTISYEQRDCTTPWSKHEYKHKRTHARTLLTFDFRTQFTTKYSTSILQHVMPYQYASVRDVHEIAPSIVQLTPVVQQCLDIRPVHPAELHRGLKTMKILAFSVWGLCRPSRQPSLSTNNTRGNGGRSRC